MPTKGKVIANPINGDTYKFIETAGDTNGQRVIMSATIKGKGQYTPNHIHVLQEETFEVLSGKLTVWSDKKLIIISAGEKITLPKNKPHNHYNNENTPVNYIHTISPALDFDYLVENLVGLAADGKSKNGNYGFVQQLVTLKYLDSKTYLANVPIGVQRLLMNIVGPIGRRLGYRAIYKKYSGIEK
jgi:quercetin dioxygenase-like cupin family protein